MIKYDLVQSTDEDIEKLIKYKKNIIYEYAGYLSKQEIYEINNYVISNVKNDIENYYNVVINGKIVGSLLLKDNEDGKLLDEVYLEENYRNKGIGTNIIKRILDSNEVVYLWVYKKNIKAISLYKKLGFNVIEETESRYYMKYSK